MPASGPWCWTAIPPFWREASTRFHAGWWSTRRISSTPAGSCARLERACPMSDPPGAGAGGGGQPAGIEPAIAAAGGGDTLDRLLGGRVVLRQPAAGYRVAIDPVLLAAAVPAES